ncbi:MAG TPA: sulfatase [Polyangiaceae bacterium]
MNRAAVRWLPRAVVGLLVGAAAVLAWREGGGADARVPPPRPAGAASSSASSPSAADPGHGAEAYEVTARLVDKLGDARIDAPALASAETYLQPYWRKMRVPWLRLPASAAPMAVTISMRTSRDFETQWAVSVPGGDTWVPQARVWNMNEGSFDQREAILAPAPATVTYSLEVPPHARLRASPAVLAGTAAPTLFTVTLVDAAGADHVLSQTRVPGAEAKRWLDVDDDLGPWAGQTVALRLQTSVDKLAPGEKRWAPPGADEADGGTATGADAPPPLPPVPLALWGDPLVVAREPTRVPYDVLWIVVDALRPDVAASMHVPDEDAAALAAPHPPLDARLPAIPGLMPGLDHLAERGVRFVHAWSAAAWTRPGTLAMLCGERSGELGVDTREWILPPDQVSRWYGAEPPLVSRILRKSGVETAAFVNNFFMAGYVTVGLDMGFERVTDHRYRARDTAEILRDASGWLDGHAASRFFLFVNFNSPHEPYDAPKEFGARIPPPPAGPRDSQVRAYMAEGAKDDAAIGALLAKLDALGLTKSTLVVVTSDHGETLSSAHAGYAMDHLPVRFHHAVGNFEETTRVPIVMALPGVLDGGRAVTDRVRSTDIAPTVLEVEGLEADARMSGRSMLGLARGQKEPDARVVVTEGRASRAVLWGPWHYVSHTDGETDEELYDLEDDPGERRNVAHAHPDVVAEMKARLAAALANAPAADAKQDPAGPLPVVHLRFAGAGTAHHVTGVLTVGDGKHGAAVTVEAVGAPKEAVRVDGPRVDFALDTAADGLVGLDLRVDPPGAPIAWKLYLDDAPWPDGAVFAGPFGLPAVATRTGIAGDEARSEAYAAALPVVDPARDLGLFVTRDHPGDASPSTPASGGQGAVEMQRMLQQWGYAHGSH